MLKPLPMEHLNRPEISAFFATRRGVPLQLIRDTLLAYNPMIRPIGHYAFITAVDDLGGTINRLRAHVIDPNYHLIKKSLDATDPSGHGSKTGELKRNLEDWEIVTEALAAGLYPSLDRVHLAKAKFGTGKRSLAEALSDWMYNDVAFYDARLPYPRILKPAEDEVGQLPVPDSTTDIAQRAEKSFIASALCLDWESLRTTGYLVNVPTAAEGVQRTSYERTMRALRITGAKIAYAIAWRVMSLRPYRLLLADAHIKARLLLEFGPSATEYMAMVDEMASLPVHRWLAIADSVTSPGRNMTPWGASTTTFGLDSHIVHKLELASERETAPKDPIHLIPWEQVFEFARTMKDELRLLREDEGLALDAATSALRFSAVGPRPRIGLMGAERLPIHVDGVNMSEALAPLDLLFRDMLPSKVYGKPMPWIGEPRMLELSELQAFRDSKPGRVWIEPETLPVVGEAVLGRLRPSQLRTQTEYQGEEDAIMTSATIEGLAELFGVTPTVMGERVKASLAAEPVTSEWRTMFAVDGATIKPLTPDLLLYVSSRTRRLAQEEVKIPSIQINKLSALQYGLVVKTEQLRAHFYRNMDVPTPTFDLSDKLRAFAVDMLGKR